MMSPMLSFSLHNNVVSRYSLDHCFKLCFRIKSLRHPEHRLAYTAMKESVIMNYQGNKLADNLVMRIRFPLLICDIVLMA